MEIEPPQRWQMLKIRFLWHLPQEPRKKIKKLLKLGDDFLSRGREDLAEYCFSLAKDLAQRSGIVHLRKKIDQRAEHLG